MKLLITINGTTHEVVPKPGDLVRFERQYDVPASSMDDSTRVEYVFYIAWCAMKRTGDFTGDFEEFLDLADTADDPTPLEPPQPLAS
jgi:hypothetical protein